MALLDTQGGREPPALHLPPATGGSTFGTFGDLNLIGLRTLYLKEVRRFMKVPAQTLLAPVVTTLIFIAIFQLALGRGERSVSGVPFIQFIAPGLIMMAIIQNAFSNTISSLIIAKVQGNIVDVLMPPLSPGELVFGHIAGGATRGLLVAVATYAAVLPFVVLAPAHPFLVVFYALAASVLLALLGFLGGLWAEKFDQTATLTNFVIMPLSFLSGTFYSIEQLPDAARVVAYVNPLFYAIDGMRFAFIDHADSPVWLGAAVLIVCNVALWWLAHRLVAAGWRLKS